MRKNSAHIISHGMWMWAAQKDTRKKLRVYRQVLLFGAVVVRSGMAWLWEEPFFHFSLPMPSKGRHGTKAKTPSQAEGSRGQGGREQDGILPILDQWNQVLFIFYLETHNIISQLLLTKFIITINLKFLWRRHLCDGDITFPTTISELIIEFPPM